MAYVPGSIHDIFVSYAHVDDQALPGAAKGWVSSLVDSLRLLLAQSLGRHDSFALWMDPSLPGNRPLTPEIIEAVRGSATLLVILSPGYVKSEWCLRELESFVAAVGGQEGIGPRIFVVERCRLAEATRPEALADRSGYVFWSGDGGVARTFSGTTPCYQEARYHDLVGRLVSQLTEELERQRRMSQDSAPSSRPKPARPVAKGGGPRSIDPPSSERASARPRVEPLPEGLRYPEESAGLFVGVGRFGRRSWLPDLRYAPDDAVALAHLLVLGLGLVAPSRAKVALGGEPASDSALRLLGELEGAGVEVIPATKTELIHAVDECAEIAAAGRGLVALAFSTHGYERGGEAYLMPSDGSRRFLEQTGLPVGLVQSLLGAVRPGPRLMIVDACRDSSDARSRGEERMGEPLHRALRSSDEMGMLASCGVGQLSWEEPEFGRGVFTHFLVEALGGLAVAGDDGLIRLENVLAFAAQATSDWARRHVKSEQVPWYEGAPAGLSLPLSVSVEAKRKIEQDREREESIRGRREVGLKRLIAARANPKNRNLITLTLQVEVEEALGRLEGDRLEKLLDMLGCLDDERPVSCELFATWWGKGGRRERPLDNSPHALPVARPTQWPRAGAEWVNSLGMKFVPLGGSLFSTWPTRVQDFRTFVEETGHDATEGLFSLTAERWGQMGLTWEDPGFPQGPTHPVAGVSWEDASAFCEWLTAKERAEGLLTSSQVYRLPDDRIWSLAAGPTKYPWGDSWPPPRGAGNYAQKDEFDDETRAAPEIPTHIKFRYAGTTPVGHYGPNALGVCDLGGNVWEWCADPYRKEMNDEDLRREFDFLNNDGVDEHGVAPYHMMRGASWFNERERDIRSSFRNFGNLPRARFANVGFRCILQLGRGIAVDDPFRAG